MPVKDRIVTWWIQNIVVPQREIIDNPGFVITTFSDKSKTTYLREIFFAEQLFELIENNIVQKYKDQGKQALYSAGKKFGYLYASMSNFPTINESSNKDFLEFIYLLVRYVEGIYAESAEHEVDLDRKMFTISFKDYIVCRHNGLGHIMGDGGITGIWAYLMQDKNIEGMQLECQGRDDNRCYIICSKDKINNSFYENDLSDQKFTEMYRALNEIRQTTFAKNSLKDLIDIGFFKYKGGILSYKDSRFFGCESHIWYLLEQELIKLKDGEKVLFDACFEYGKLLQETYEHADYKKFIPDFFSALGFGDIVVMNSDKISIATTYYPWTVFSDKSKYVIFRGIMSGFISNSLGKKIEFNNFDITVRDNLTLIIKL